MQILMDDELEQANDYLLGKLRLPLDSRIEDHFSIKLGNREFLIDKAVESLNYVTLIELKSRINEDTVYRIYALSTLLEAQRNKKDRIRLVCAGKSVKYSTQELADKLGVEIVILPHKLYNILAPVQYNSTESNREFSVRTSPAKITSHKAWKIICTILSKRPPSILSLSKEANVSYGWTNSIIHKLGDAGIIHMSYGLMIKDLDKLFNAVSWERPLESFHVETIHTRFKISNDCINEVALNLNKLGIEYAFTAHSSALYYGSTTIRDDTAYIYLPDPRARQNLKIFSVNNEKGCALKVYTPDRDIMASSQILGGVRIVSFCQNLLDLAGLGIDGRTSLKELVSKDGKK